MPPSKKPAIFVHLFYWRYDAAGMKSERWDPTTKTIPEDRRLVYANEIALANVETKAGLGHNQPSNFSKDFLRKATRSRNWPKSLAELRWTAKQKAGIDPSSRRLRNFLFMPYTDGQADPFPDECPIPTEYTTHHIQSVTMSVGSKQIARLDEPRLMQIFADLRVVETHFALFSPLRSADFDLIHMDLLQMGLKLKGAEIDGLYLAEFQDRRGVSHPVLITVEAKKHDELIIKSQIIAQVEHAAALGVPWAKIVPIAVKHANGGAFVFEFAPFDAPPSRKFEKDSLDQDLLSCEATVFYEVVPPIAGLSRAAKKPRISRVTPPRSSKSKAGLGTKA